MPRPNASRWLLASAATHALVLALVSLVPPRVDAASSPATLQPAELRFDLAPVPQPSPAAAAHPAPPSVAPPLPRAAPREAVARPSRVATPSPPPAPPTVVPTEPPPAPPTPVPPAPSLRASDLYRASSTMVPSLALAPAPDVDTSSAPSRALFPGTSGDTNERLRVATQGYVRETLSTAARPDAPGVRSYLWNVRRRMTEAWRPGVVRVPNLGETLLAGFIPPERAMRIFGERFMRRQHQLMAPQERLGGAADAIEAIGGVAGNGPSMRQGVPSDTGEESWRRNVRTTRVEVRVDQDVHGAVRDIRVLHSSGIDAFDRAALDAVRQGLSSEDPMDFPGGRTSRWSFTVVASRRLFTASAGGTFDESRGWFSLQLPGQVSIRTRVQMESSGALETATP